MTGFAGHEPTEHLHRSVDDLERRLADSAGRLGRMREVGTLVADVRGHADSADGHVHVEWGQGGPTGLTIDPRALRMPSEDLAEAVRSTVAAAIADHRQRTMDALRDADLLPDAAEVQTSLEQAQGQLGTAQEDLSRSLRAAVAVLGQASRRRPT